MVGSIVRDFQSLLISSHFTIFPFHHTTTTPLSLQVLQNHKLRIKYHQVITYLFLILENNAANRKISASEQKVMSTIGIHFSFCLFWHLLQLVLRGELWGWGTWVIRVLVEVRRWCWGGALKVVREGRSRAKVVDSWMVVSICKVKKLQDGFVHWRYEIAMSIGFWVRDQSQLGDAPTLGKSILLYYYTPA